MPAIPNRVWVPYCGAAPDPSEWLARWNFDPVVVAILVMAILYCAMRRSASSTQRRRSSVVIRAFSDCG